MQNCTFSTGRYRKKGTCLDFIFTQFHEFSNLSLDSPYLQAVALNSQFDGYFSEIQHDYLALWPQNGNKVRNLHSHSFQMVY